MVSTDGKSLANLTKNRSQIGVDMCFICDQRITGERLKLSTTLAPHSKLGLAEKVSNLIGDDFVVIVTDNDLVCKRCASLLNHMDKLENELVLVKKALVNYLKQKYDLPIEEPTLLTASNNSDDEESNDEDVAEKSSQEPAVEAPAPPATPLPTASTNIGMAGSPLSVNNRKRPAPAPKGKETPTRAKLESPFPQKMKIYKCGFCVFQSKDLNTVRLHMKVHVKPTVKRDEDLSSAAKPQVSTPPPQVSAPTPHVSALAPQGSVPTTPVPSSVVPTTQVSTPTVTASTAVKRRLFRCQVCSLSFDDRAKCVEHISLEHTSIGKRRALEEKRLAAANALASKDKLAQPDSSTSGVKVPPATADDPVSSLGNENEYLNTGEGAVTDSVLTSDLDQNSSVQQSTEDQSVKVERELEQSAQGYGMETDSVDQGRVVPSPAVPNPQVSTQTVTASNAKNKRIFRCQLCSLSFEDRSKCVEHINLEHTSVGKKRALELEEKKLAAANDSASKDKQEAVWDQIGHATSVGVKEDPASDGAQIPPETAAGSELATDLLNTGDKPMETDDGGNKEVHSIDIAAMIAALRSDGPQEQI